MDAEARLSRLFGMYDVDADGMLTREDLTAYSRRLSEQLPGEDNRERRAMLHSAYAEMWQQLVTAADTDRSGRISEQEFLAATARGAFDGDTHFRASTLRAVDALADALDTDGDGRISRQEYGRIFALTGTGEGSPELAFTAVDADADGWVSRAELRRAAVDLFPLADPTWLAVGDVEVGPTRRGIALVAHDARKSDLLAWATERSEALSGHELYGTGTTGRLLHDRLGLEVTALRSGPLGGDQQIGARISEGAVNLLIFFWDPLSSHPHGDDVRALIRLAVLANIPIAFNSATADLLLDSLPESVPA